MNTTKTILATLAIMVSAVFATPCQAKKKVQESPITTAPAVVVITTSNDSLSYAAGIAMAMDVLQTIDQRMLPGMNNYLSGTDKAIDGKLFRDGFMAALQNDTTIMANYQQAAEYFNKRMEAAGEEKAKAAQEKNTAWLAENAKKEGVVVLPSGLQYKVITEGKGAKPKADQEVTVKYEGHLIDGTEFDSSYKRNPDTNKFRCNQVVQGWTEALQLMSVGSKWEVYVPQELGYGSRQTGNIPAFSTLIFTIELVDITK